MPNFRDVVDAFFFSRGQYRDRSDNIPERSTWWGFRPGTSVTVRVSSSVSGDHRSALRRLVDQSNQSLPGLYQISVDEPGISLDNAVLSRQFVLGQVIVAEVSADVVRSNCAGVSPAACAIMGGAGEFPGSLVVLGPTNDSRIVQHEFGHALLGLGHVFMQPPTDVGDSFSWWERLVMGMIPAVTVGTTVEAFSSFEVELLKAVHEAGLRPGDSRDAFFVRGLVN